jgi:hypothetical protein
VIAGTIRRDMRDRKPGIAVAGFGFHAREVERPAERREKTDLI